MSIRRLLGLKQPAPIVMTPPQSPIKPQTLEAVFGVESLSSASPAAPQAPTGVLPKIGPLPFRSETCSSHHFLLACYQYWCNEFKEPPRYHRKQWEFVYILHALWERGLLAPEKRGLGFGVGREPLTAVMAARGCSVTATDLEIEAQTQTAWAATNEHSAALNDLNERGICDESTFLEKVTFVPANMNNIPSDLQDSISAGLRAVSNIWARSRPGWPFTRIPWKR